MLENRLVNLGPKGNLLIGSRVGVGKCVVNEIDIAINQDITAICLDPQNTCPYFLAFYFKTEFAKFFIQIRKKGATIQGITRFDIEAIPIALPPLKEQKAIVNVLRAIYDTIEIRKKELNLQRELKEAFMAYLFTYGTKNEPLKKTEIGFVPESWQVSELQNYIIKPEYGVTASASKKNDGPRFVRITDIQEGKINWEEVPFMHRALEKNEDKKQLVIGDILIARIGATTGKSFFVRTCVNSVFASYLIRLRTISTLLYPEYLYYFMQTKTYWDHIERNKGGRLKGGINIPILNCLKIPFPSLTEQKSISTILSSIDKKTETIELELALYEELFQAMLEELMTGKVSTMPLIENCKVAS